MCLLIAWYGAAFPRYRVEVQPFVDAARDFRDFRHPILVQEMNYAGLGESDSDAPERTEFRGLYLPLRLFNENAAFEIKVHTHLRDFHPRIFHIGPDDCLQLFEVNGQKLREPYRTCNWYAGLRVDLGDLLVPGENTFRFIINNIGGPGGLEIRPSIRDPAVYSFWILFTVSLLYFFSLAPRSWRHTSSRTIYASYLLTVGLLIGFYSICGPEGFSYDLYGHQEYLDYVSKHWSLPAARSSWQSYQPPLYYFASVTWVRILDLLGVHDFSSHDRVVLFATILALLSAGVIHLCVKELFPLRQQSLQALLCAQMACSFPAFVFNSTRISNDTLLQLVLALLIFFSLRMYKHSLLPFCALLITYGLTVLTKSNGVHLLPMLLFAVARGKLLRHRTRLESVLIALLVTITISCGYTIFRMRDGQAHFVGNIDQNSPDLFLEDSISSFVSFNPWEVVEMTFNDCCSIERRSDRVWEVLFRSAYFGFFFLDWYNLAPYKGVLSLGLILLIVTCCGIYLCAKKLTFQSTIMGLVLLCSLGAILGIRLMYSNPGFAEVRYVPMLTFAWAYFAACGLSSDLWLLRKFSYFICFSHVAAMYALLLSR